MKDKIDDSQSESELEGPEAICVRFFSRCSNWPAERLGVIGLAQALARASREHGMTPLQLAERCASLSRYCPTDADLFTIAEETGARRKESEEARRDELWRQRWRQQHGAPEPFDWESAIDWKRVTAVHARHTEMWRKLADFFQVKKRANRWPDHETIARAMDDLGYHDYAYAQRRCGPAGANWASGAAKIPEAALAKCGGPGVLQNWRGDE